VSPASVSFAGRIVAGRGGGAYVEVPVEVCEALGAGGRMKVAATFDGHAYRGSVVRMHGVHVLGVRKDVRAAIGVGVGDVVTVVLRRDEEPRTVAVPEELAAALKASPEAETRFETLSYTHRREYAGWVAEAKKAETRERRAAKAVVMLEEGKTR